MSCINWQTPPRQNNRSPQSLPFKSNLCWPRLLKSILISMVFFVPWDYAWHFYKVTLLKTVMSHFSVARGNRLAWKTPHTSPPGVGGSGPTLNEAITRYTDLMGFRSSQRAEKWQSAGPSRVGQGTAAGCSKDTVKADCRTQELEWSDFGVPSSLLQELL